MPMEKVCHQVLPNIMVSNPVSYELIGNVLILSGKARVFENTVNFHLKDRAGNTLVKDYVTAQSTDMGKFGSFYKETVYAPPQDSEGILEVFQVSARDGTEIDKVIIPVIFEERELINISVYFRKASTDSSMQACDKVFAVPREMEKTQAVAFASIEQLIKGPTENEKGIGYFSAINPETRIISIDKTDDDIVEVNFDSIIEHNVAGSCGLIAIRAQIEETLKQFPSVADVVIMVEGSFEDVLQP